ncbi:MAG: ribosome assembly RNA-binding protein YhbY [Moraxellaceae bacterium]|nr:ribosome assembly RNA-binding protein YhbY [Moraxellaceae bacterium]
MLQLTPAQRRDLRAKAHHLNPVVSIAGNGLTPAVLAEIERSLKAHELIKVRVYGDERAVREEILNTVCAELGCAAVQHIGKLLVLFRPNLEEAAPATSASGKPARPRIAGGKLPGVSSGARPKRDGPIRTTVTSERPARVRKPTAGSGRMKKSAR